MNFLSGYKSGSNGRLLFLLLLLYSPLGVAADLELSAHLNLVGSSGKPTNDVLGVGVVLHQKISEGWYLGYGLDYSSKFDFERPNNLLDIKSETETDAVGSMTMVSLVAERRFELEADGWSGFWNLGAAFNEVDLDNAEGNIRGGGGTFDIETDVDTEFVLLGSAGWMQQIGKNLSARYTLAAEHHSGDWDVRDVVSGATGKIGDYALYGLRVGLTYRF